MLKNDSIYLYKKTYFAVVVLKYNNYKKKQKTDVHKYATLVPVGRHSFLKDDRRDLFTMCFNLLFVFGEKKSLRIYFLLQQS